MGCVDITYYIVFTDINVEPHWVHRFIRKGFKHCFCFYEIEGERFCLNTTTANINYHLGVDAAFFKNSTVLKFKYKFDFNNKIFYFWNMLPTCVSITKMVLGIRSRAITPYQLYKYLIKQGAFYLK